MKVDIIFALKTDILTFGHFAPWHLFPLKNNNNVHSHIKMFGTKQPHATVSRLSHSIHLCIQGDTMPRNSQRCKRLTELGSKLLEKVAQRVERLWD